MREPVYHYARFSADDYDLGAFPGPEVGEVVDFEARTLDGAPVRLSDYAGSTVVLESGSLTCSIYVQNIPAMQELARRFPDVVFLMLYVREAHPGSKVPAITALEDKRRRVLRLRQEDGENRRVLLDDLDGSVHRRLGLLPDVLYVFAPDGRVLYRCNWANPERLAEVLAAPERARRTERFEPEMKGLVLTVRVLLRAGWDALIDFGRELPRLLWRQRQINRRSSRPEPPTATPSPHPGPR